MFDYDDPDPLLILRGPVYPRIPEQFSQFVDAQKKKSEWQLLGFKVTCDARDNFNAIRKYGCYYRFMRVAK